MPIRENSEDDRDRRFRRGSFQIESNAVETGRDEAEQSSVGFVTVQQDRTRENSRFGVDQIAEVRCTAARAGRNGNRRVFRGVRSLIAVIGLATTGLRLRFRTAALFRCAGLRGSGVLTTATSRISQHIAATTPLFRCSERLERKPDRSPDKRQQRHRTGQSLPVGKLRKMSNQSTEHGSVSEQ